jgi:putative transposase
MIPVQKRGRQASAPGGPTGTRIFFHHCPSGRYRYRVTSKQQHSATVTILVRRLNQGGREGQHGRFNWAYAVWRMDFGSVRSAPESYRRRFRIESSYRLLETGRGRTSSRDEGLRLWYIVLAVVLVNQWLQLHWTASRRWGAGEAGCCWFLELLLTLVHRHVLVLG